MSWPWSELGLSGPAALPEIRSAYAQRLKATHPEEDPEGFQRLHTAYQEASRQARRRAPAAPDQSSASAAWETPARRAVQCSVRISRNRPAHREQAKISAKTPAGR